MLTYFKLRVMLVVEEKAQERIFSFENQYAYVEPALLLESFLW